MDTAFTPSPSFRDSAAASAAAAVSAASDERRSSGDGSQHWISVSAEELNRPPKTADDNGSTDEFEFTFSPADIAGAPADDIFSDGCLLPLFNCRRVAALAAEKAVRVPLRELLSMEREAYSRSGTVSSFTDGLDGVPSETFCMWDPLSVPPSPEQWRKSRSTGSASRRCRLRDLVFGRSHSDGKDRYGFVEVAEEKVAPEMEKVAKTSPGRVAAKTAAKGSRMTGVGMVTAYKLYYTKDGGINGGRRRSFLPYRQDLVGLFAGGNGFSRKHHQFY